MNFDDLTYLKQGSTLQRNVYGLLKEHQILDILSRFNPVLVGTFPLDIAVDGSDLDIACCWITKSEFITVLKDKFGHFESFVFRETIIDGNETVVANFLIDAIPVEIFAQNIPVKSQVAYRHMIQEYEILASFGVDFKQKIIELKQKGYKTEPAFTNLLGIEGDPYLELLKFELDS